MCSLHEERNAATKEAYCYWYLTFSASGLHSIAKSSGPSKIKEHRKQDSLARFLLAEVQDSLREGENRGDKSQLPRSRQLSGKSFVNIIGFSQIKYEHDLTRPMRKTESVCKRLKFPIATFCKIVMTAIMPQFVDCLVMKCGIFLESMPILFYLNASCCPFSDFTRSRSSGSFKLPRPIGKALPMRPLSRANWGRS
jgi:hypothetical protein